MYSSLLLIYYSQCKICTPIAVALLILSHCLAIMLLNSLPMAITLAVIAVTANTATLPIPVAIIAIQLLTELDAGSWYKQQYSVR